MLDLVLACDKYVEKDCATITGNCSQYSGVIRYYNCPTVLESANTIQGSCNKCRQDEFPRSATCEIGEKRGNITPPNYEINEIVYIRTYSTCGEDADQIVLCTKCTVVDESGAIECEMPVGKYI